jgi:hypothetical protein
MLAQARVGVSSAHGIDGTIFIPLLMWGLEHEEPLGSLRPNRAAMQSTGLPELGSISCFVGAAHA